MIDTVWNFRDGTSIRAGSTPDWRFQLAGAAAQEGRLLPPGLVGRQTHELGLLLWRELRGARPSSARKSPAARRVARALEIACEPSRRHAHLLEVCVLADERQYDTAARLQLKVGLVNAYETLFFDIRSVLRDWSFIRSAAIEPELTRGPAVDRRRFAMKLIAYRCGMGAVDGIYGSGPLPGDWIDPLQLVQREAAQAALDGLADLYTSATVGPGQLRAVSENIAECLKRLALPPQPRSKAERLVNELSSALGGLEIADLENVLDNEDSLSSGASA